VPLLIKLSGAGAGAGAGSGAVAWVQLGWIGAHWTCVGRIMSSSQLSEGEVVELMRSVRSEHKYAGKSMCSGIGSAIGSPVGAHGIVVLS
jgi:hypothetical protein